MKRIFIIIITIFICISTACANANNNNNKNPVSTKKGAEEMKIKIDITSDSGNHILEAKLTDNSSGVAFYKLLKQGPITINMHDYGNFEKVGSIGTTLPRNDTQITTSAGDIILYQGNQITIYYDVNSWNFTSLGKIISILQQDSNASISPSSLKYILGKGNVKAVFYINE